MPRYPIWTPEEYDLLYLEIKLKTPLLELEDVLKRPHNGILQKLQQLSAYFPYFYHPEIIRWYQRQFHKLHHERFLRYCGKYRQVHGEEIRERNAEKRDPKKKRDYRLAHHDSISAYLKAWKLKRQRKFIISCLKQRIETAKAESLETVLETIVA